MRRIGSTPAERGSVGANNCPDVFEMEDGNFFVIGKVVMADQAPDAGELRRLGASIGTDELAVIVPRDCLLAAAKQLVTEGIVG